MVGVELLHRAKVRGVRVCILNIPGWECRLDHFSLPHLTFEVIHEPDHAYISFI